MGLLNDYLSYTSSHEAPESYHTWSCLSMVSAILGKRAWVRFNYFTTFPNLYLILVSQPGVGKKSTAMRMAKKLADKAKAPIHYSNDNQTSQALIGELERSFTQTIIPDSGGKLYLHSSVTTIASELVSLLTQGPPMVDFLTDIYDSQEEYIYRTKGAGTNTIKNPCLNVLSGVTTKMLNTRIIKDAQAGGFMSRSIIIYDNKIRPSSRFDMASEEQEEKARQVVAYFEEIQTLFGEFTFTKEAKSLFIAFEDAVSKQKQRESQNIEFISRKDDHAAKVCILLAAMDLTTVIKEEHVALAVKLLNDVEHNMKVIHMSTGQHSNADILPRLLNTLVAVGGYATHTQVLESFMTDYDEEAIDKALGMMITVGYIERREGKEGMEVVITKKGRGMCGG